MTYIAFILFFIPLPLLLGMPFLDKKDRMPYSLLFSWVFGFLALFAAGYIPALIGVFCDWSLTCVYRIWLIILAAAACFSAQYVFRHRRALLPSGRDTRLFLKEVSFPEILCVLLVLLHAYVTFRYMHVDDDDAVYIAAATTSLDTNTVMRFNPMTGDPLAVLGQFDTVRICVSPLHVLYACISRLFRLRPAALAHTYLPPFLTVACYASAAMAGAALFQKDRKKTALFTIFVFLVNAFSYVSIYTSGTFLSTRIWQGKGFFVGVIIPLLLWYYLYLAGKNGTVSFRDTSLLMLLYGTSGLLTVMGMVLLCIMGFVLALLTSWKTKRILVLTRFLICMIFPAVISVLYILLSRNAG